MELPYSINTQLLCREGIWTTYTKLKKIPQESKGKRDV
jgi:hypothetical protein